MLKVEVVEGVSSACGIWKEGLLKRSEIKQDGIKFDEDKEKVIFL